MLRLPLWIPLCSALLLLAPGASQARRQGSPHVEGYIIQAPSPADPTLIIEAGYETVVLRVNRKTDVGFFPPPPPGEGGDLVAALEVGRRASASYNRQSHVALTVGVSATPEVAPVEGWLRAAGPLNTVTIDVRDPLHPPTEASLVDFQISEQTRISVNDLPLRADELPLFLSERVEALKFINSSNLERLRVRLFPLAAAVGTVRSIDPETRQLRVALTTGLVDLVAPSGLEVQLGDRIVPFSAVQPGDWVRLSYGNTAAGLHVALGLGLQRILPRTVSARLTDVDPVARTLTLTGPGPDTFQVLPDTPITFEWDGLPNDELLPEPITLAQLKALLPETNRINVTVEFVLRGKTRIATRVTTTARQQPPPSPTGAR